MHFAGASSLGHNKRVRVALVSRAVVHYAETMAELVRNHKRGLKVGRLVYCATVVSFAHSADPSQAKNAAVILSLCRLVQIQTVCICVRQSKPSYFVIVFDGKKNEISLNVAANNKQASCF